MFGDPGSGAEKVTNGLAPSLAHTPTKSCHKSQPQQETVTLSLSVSLWLSSGVTVRESSHLLAAPWKQELDNASVGLVKHRVDQTTSLSCDPAYV